jgi:hypothetical protein
MKIAKQAPTELTMVTIAFILVAMEHTHVMGSVVEDIKEMEEIEALTVNLESSGSEGGSKGSLFKGWLDVVW